MDEVGKGFGMHQPMLDCDVEKHGVDFPNDGIETSTHLIHISTNIRDCGPVRGLILGFLAGVRIDAEREEAIECRMEGRQSTRVPPDQIPVEGVDVAKVEDGTMPLGHRAFVPLCAADKLKEVIGMAACRDERTYCSSLTYDRLPHVVCLSSLLVSPLSLAAGRRMDLHVVVHDILSAG